MITQAQTSEKPWGLYVALLLAALLLIRIPVLLASPVELHGDEAQYWSWAQNLDWGYFSKPPLIAWMIALTTGIFGDAEWAIRISSPILHTVTATMLYITAKFLYGAKTGFFAALIYILMPGVSLSAGIVSTDVPLLLCWITALYAVLRWRGTPAWRWALLAGIAIGLGCLAKYAMLFFVPALLVAIIIDAPTRKAFLTSKGIAAGLIAILVLTPNIIWNAANDFATVSHTAANANISGVPFHPSELIEFWGEQTGVFGPLTLVLFVLALIAALRGKLGKDAIFLSLFALSPLIIISIEALLSRANANWAVTTYVAGTLLTARYVVHLLEKKWAFNAAMLINVGLGLTVMIGAVSPAFVNAIGQANAFKRNRGWVDTKVAISDIAALGHNGSPYSVIAMDNRLVFYDMNYYGLAETAPIRMWLHTAHASNHAEATAALSETDGEPILLVNYYDDYEDEFRADFQRLEPAGEIDIDLGGGKRRKLTLWAAYGYKMTDR